MTENIYNQNLDKCQANYQPLSPLFLLKRTAEVFPNHPAIIYGSEQYSYKEFYQRTKCLASALEKYGIGVGDTVSVMLANTPIMLEMHYAVPMVGAVLHSINTRLNAEVIAYQLKHCESKLVFCDSHFAEPMKEALKNLDDLTVVDFIDLELAKTLPEVNENRISKLDYQSFLATGSNDFKWHPPEDEWDAITVNYTSGTTGKPKGAVYSHRGAMLLANGNALTVNMPKHSVYLWTLPMFHCNGWCFPWTISALAGTHICLREVRGKAIWQALKQHRITHLCGAPAVMNTILETPLEDCFELDWQVDFLTAAAPPPESVLAAMKERGFNVIHLYGLTEVYGPAVINDWHQSWNNLSFAKQTELKARQGVRYHALEDLDVCNPDTLEPVDRDGKTIGEVMFRGNVVMKGYLKNADETIKSLKGGWFHSGDLAVIHPDGYIQLKDRSKDIIISGGENISSIEIEEALYKNPEVKVAAVVAMPDEKWGESPCAFIEKIEGSTLTEEQILEGCKKHLARYKMPKKIIFQGIEKTSTGKVQKFILREQAKKSITINKG